MSSSEPPVAIERAEPIPEGPTGAAASDATGTALGRWAPYLVWVALGVCVFEYALEIRAGGDAWKTADWLIHYGQGMVRRGLTGSLLIGLLDGGARLLWGTFALQVASYLLVYAYVFRIYRLAPRADEWLVFLLSPAFLMFPFYAGPGGFRKEILAFAPFAILAFSYARGAVSRATLATVVAMFVFAAFSHEIAVFSLPFFLWVLFASAKERILGTRDAAVAAAVLVVAAAGALAVSVESPAVSPLMCADLVRRDLPPGICGGALLWLQRGTDSWRWEGIAWRDLAPFVRFYAIVLVLSIAPLWLIPKLGRDLRTAMLVGFAALLPLYATAIDWGRWIHVFVFFSFTSVLAWSARRDVRLTAVPRLAIGCYVALWSFPHCCADKLSEGLVERLLGWAHSFVRMAS